MTTIKPKSSIEIYTDKEQYKPGEELNVKVLLKIKKDMKCKDLYIALMGEIFCKTHIHQLDKVKAKWTDVEMQEEKKQLLYLEKKLYTFKETKQKKGEQNTKFSIKLPDNLEFASMYCKGSYGISRDASQHYSQHVKYSLKAWVTKPKKSKGDQIIGRQIIHIRKNHKFDIPPQVYMRHNFTFCYCFVTGHLDLGLQLEKTEYQASERLRFEFDYDNYPANDRKPISIRWQVLRKLIFKDKEYCKPYMQGELDNFLQKSHQKEIELPLAMTMTHKSSFVQVINVFQIEYCLPNEVVIPICQEFAVTKSNPPQKAEDDKDIESMGSRLSDVNREEIICSEVNFNNGKVE